MHSKHCRRRPWTHLAGRVAGAAVLVVSVAAGIPAARAQTAEAPKSPALTFAATYKADVLGVVAGGGDHGARYLDELMLAADTDLDRAVGWKDAQVHVTVINSLGGRPNDLAGTIQGLDNIEVSRNRLRLYEAWLEQRFAGGRVSVRAGAYDLNSEFDVTDSSGVLIQPPYGISPEFAASGPRGAPVFPSLALGVRFKLQPRDDVYVQAAALDALAGSVGDPGGLDTSFSAGALMVAEAGWTGSGKVAVGAWRYTQRLADIRDLTGAGAPVQRTAQGVYLLLDHPLNKPADGVRQASAFLRLGLSDGDTSPLRSGGQAGVLIKHVFRGRPDSALSFGAAWTTLGSKFRADSADAGAPLSHAETSFELTYSDTVCPHLSIQPDLQYVHRPSGDPAVKDAVIVGLRTTLAF